MLLLLQMARSSRRVEAQVLLLVVRGLFLRMAHQPARHVSLAPLSLLPSLLSARVEVVHEGIEPSSAREVFI